MGLGAGLYMYVIVVQKFTFAISSPDEFLFLIVDTCLSCKDRPRQICAMVSRRGIFGDFLGLAFQTCILNSH